MSSDDSHRPTRVVAPSAKALARRLLPHTLYRRYRRRKVASLIAAYRPREVTHNYGGHTLRVWLTDPLAEGWYDHDWDPLEAVAFLRERGVLRPGARIIDLGAHQGIVALMLAREVGETGQVVAVEAEPHNARVAAANRELNGAENLTVLHAAGAASTGTISFAEGLNGQIDEHTSAGNVEVAAVTIDDLAREHGMPDLVLVDVEGYEGAVLDGARETLAGCSTSFLVELHEELSSYGGQAAQIVDLFSGFERFVAVEDDDPFLPLEGAPPSGRFFLIALAAAGRHDQAG
jgi:FkbM family methyltransferase